MKTTKLVKEKNTIAINQDIEGISFNKKNQCYISNIINIILKDIY